MVKNENVMNMVIKIRESDLDEVEEIIGSDEFHRLGLDECQPGGDVEIVDDDYDEFDASNAEEFLAEMGYDTEGNRIESEECEISEYPDNDSWSPNITEAYKYAIKLYVEASKEKREAWDKHPTAFFDAVTKVVGLSDDDRDYMQSWYNTDEEEISGDATSLQYHELEEDRSDIELEAMSLLAEGAR